MSALREELGDEVTGLVLELTNPYTAAERLPWQQKRRREKKKYKTLSEPARRVKLADRCDNLAWNDMPAGRRAEYLDESRMLAEVVGPADAELHRRLIDVIERLAGGC